MIFLLALLPDVSLSGDTHRGHVWIADQGAGRVFALDRSGKEIRSIQGLGQVRDFDVRPNGSVITGGLDGKIREFDRSGAKIWEHRAREGVYSIRYLPNGNFLVGEYNSVVELTRDRKIVWEYGGGNCPEDLQALPDGHVLIAWYGSGKIEEVDRDKRVVWSLATDGPMSVQRLRNGATLVGGVREHSVRFVSREGKVVWQHTMDGDTPHASSTPSGDLLVSTWQSVQRVDRDHRVRWTCKGLAQAIKVREY